MPAIRTGPGSVAFDAVLVGALAAHRTADVHLVPPPWQLPSHLASAGLAVAAAMAGGATADDLGLSPRRAVAGATWGAAHAALTVAGLAVASRLPAIGDFLDDPRVAGASDARIRFHALVEIPFGTAVPEELVFQSVLLARTRRRWSDGPALAVQGILFGLWHVLPALEDRRHNPAVASRPAWATIVPTVLATGAAGVLLGRLRLRTGSVLAPVVAHAGINAGTLLLARRRSRRAGGAAPVGSAR